MLEACTTPMPRLCAVIAYYPTYIPDAGTSFPPSLNYQIHIAETQPFSAKSNCYIYHQSDVGFAERVMPTYDRISAQLAWTRTISCLRKGFEINIDLSPVWENHTMVKYYGKDLEQTMNALADDACVNYVPVMIGG